MQKTAIILLFGISTLVLLGLCIVQRQQIQILSARCALPESAVAPAAAAARDDTSIIARKTQATQKRLIAIAQSNNMEVVSRIKPQSAVAKAMPIASTDASVPTNESPMAGIAQMMKNPGMKDMIRAQQKGQMDLSYGALFKYLQLSDEDLETFKNGLLDKQMALMSISLDMMNNAMTPEEKKAATNQIKETTAAYDAWIKQSLGEEGYAFYQSFEATQPDRRQVTLFKGALDASNQMTEEQEGSLIEAMHDERTKFKYSATSFGDNQTADPVQFTPERIAKVLEESAKLQEQYVSRAAAILTPSQLEKFKTSLKQQQAMQEMGMKMAAKMFGQPSK